MSTRSMIGMRVGNQIHAIYCHFDGYPEHQMPILSHYSTAKQVKELLALGDLSILGPKIGEKHAFDSHGGHAKDVEWCLAYGRDRGEDNTEKSVYRSTAVAKRCMQDRGADYFYLFEDDKWSVVEM